MYAYVCCSVGACIPMSAENGTPERVTPLHNVGRYIGLQKKQKRNEHGQWLPISLDSKKVGSQKNQSRQQ